MRTWEPWEPQAVDEHRALFLSVDVLPDLDDQFKVRR